MSIVISGYSVVVKKQRIEKLLEDEIIVPPNGMHIADNDIWRCGFMAESDAIRFTKLLEEQDLNCTQGPDSDAVIVSEFNSEVHPYCEWLKTTRWEKSVLAWKIGSDPRKLFALEGFDPKVGSGLSFQDKTDMKDLEFVRLDGNVEVYFHKKLGKEVYIGRTETPVEALFKTASEVIRKHFRTAGEPVVTGKDHEEVTAAIEKLDKVLAETTGYWQAMFFHGKGHIALGNQEAALESLKQAFEIEKETEAIPRELGGVCLELGRFDEAIELGQRAASLQPDNGETLSNLALCYLLGGKLTAARKSIDSSLKLLPGDKIGLTLAKIIGEVETGARSQPTSMADLQKPVSQSQAKTGAQKESSKPFWKFW